MATIKSIVPSIMHAYFDQFLPVFETALNSVRDEESPLSMALFDIDWFGRLNDTHSRAGGDVIIEYVSATLAEMIGAKGEVLRYGGDAFAVVMQGIEKEEAFLVAETVRNRFDIEHIVYVANQAIKFSLTVSAGLASYPDDGATSVGIIRKANEALYRAKAGGRNKVCLAREERMVTKTSHYTQGQLAGLSRLAKRMGMGEAVLLREALDDVLRKYNA